MKSASFERLAGTCAILAGIFGFLYALVFLIIARNSPDPGRLLSGLLLFIGALFATGVYVALYQRLRETDPGLALWALLLGTAGAVGSMVHGAYDLANGIQPPAALPDLPNPIDPRGVLTFGLTGVSVFFMAWLMGRTAPFPRGLQYLGYVLALLLIVLYVDRLIILDATNPLIAGPAALTGFLLNPAWYLWIGRILLSDRE